MLENSGELRDIGPKKALMWASVILSLRSRFSCVCFLLPKFGCHFLFARSVRGALGPLTAVRRLACSSVVRLAHSVGNTVFSAFPPLHPGRPALPRPEERGWAPSGALWCQCFRHCHCQWHSLFGGSSQISRWYM